VKEFLNINKCGVDGVVLFLDCIVSLDRLIILLIRWYSTAYFSCTSRFYLKKKLYLLKSNSCFNSFTIFRIEDLLLLKILMCCVFSL